jgi:hypothetical protein
MSSDPLGDPISGLNAADTLTGAEIVPLTQSTRTRRTTLQLIADWIIQTATSFAQSGIGAIAGTVEDALQLFVHTSQYSTQGNFDTALAALSGTFGVAALEVTDGITQLVPGTNEPVNSGLIVWETTHADRADFRVASGEFPGSGGGSGTINATWRVGYNVANGGGRFSSSEPAWGLAFESDFDTGSAQYMELHYEGVHADGTTFRNMSWAIERTTKYTDHSIAQSQLNLYDRTFVNAAFTFLFTTTTATMGVEDGSQIRKEDNNTQWLSQLNAAADAYIEIARVNENDEVELAPAGGAVIVPGTLEVTGNTFADSITATSRVTAQNLLSSSVVALSASDVDIALGTSLVLVVRDTSNGGTAFVLYENGATPVIVSQNAGSATTWVVAAPNAGEIQLKDRTGNGGVAILANANRNNANVSVSVMVAA